MSLRSPPEFEGAWAVVLAAGASRRMGSPKQMLDWEGVPLVRRAVDAARAVLGSRVVLVTGAGAGQLEAAISGTGARVVHNPDWARGLATSIRTGVQALPGDCRRVIFTSCDQPGIGAAQLRRLLLAAQDEDAVAAARYDDTLGIPACFPGRCFAALQSLEGDQGARSLLRGDHRVIGVEMPEARWDLDCPADIPVVTRALERKT